MKMLEKGTGTPYIAMFDESNQPILDLSMGLPLGVFVDKFKYVYTEDGCDTATIDLQTSNINIADHPGLQYLMTIKLQWGWIYPDGGSKSGPVRSLVVKDYSLSFTNEGVKMTLELSDSSFLLKTEPPTHNGGKNKPLSKDDNIYKHIEGAIKGTPYNIKIVDITPTKN